MTIVKNNFQKNIDDIWSTLLNGLIYFIGTIKIIKRKGPIGVGEAIATVDGVVAAKGELTFAVV